LEAQTGQIKTFIVEAKFKEHARALESYSRTYKAWRKRGDGNNRAKLWRNQYKTSDAYHHIKGTIGEYLSTFQKSNHGGKCIEMSAMWTWLQGVMVNAYLGSYVGCVDGFKQRQEKFNKTNDCTLEIIKKDMIDIEDTMTDYLSQCTHENAVKWTKAYIQTHVIKSGNGYEQKNKIQTFLDTYYPEYYYAIVAKVAYGFTASGADIYLTYSGRAVAVSMTTVKSFCDDSSITKGEVTGIAQRISVDQRHDGIVMPTHRNLADYRLSHDLTMVAVYKQGTTVVKGLKACKGHVRVWSTATSSRKVYYLAINQWKCSVDSRGYRSGPCHIQN